MWEVEFTNEFEAWFDGLTAEQQRMVVEVVAKLQQHGPNLNRPFADRLEHSIIPNLKELRVRGNLRVLFVFDPRRCAILLLGGDKTGLWEEWYQWAIPEAERIYGEYLAELENEGRI